MNSITLRLTGASPLIMHSDRLANPLSAEAKQHKTLTSKRKKTEEDQLAIARSEYNSSLYLDGSGRVVIPTINLRSCFIDGAKLNKHGAPFQRGTMILAEHVVLEHDGPKDAAKLFDNPRFVDCRSVVVSRARLMRYRPRFDTWALTVELLYDELAIDRDAVISSAVNAGSLCGLGDFRPTKKGPFGRFTCTEMA